MVSSGNEKETSHEAKAAQSGEEACALRRGAQESVGGREEITEEMKMAGAMALIGLDWTFISREDAAVAVFRAMCRASKTK